MAHGPQEECKAFQLIVEEGIAARTDLDLGQALPQVPWDIGKAPLSLFLRFPALSRNFQLRQGNFHFKVCLLGSGHVSSTLFQHRWSPLKHGTTFPPLF